jgi:hypothetical protein
MYVVLGSKKVRIGIGSAPHDIPNPVSASQKQPHGGNIIDFAVVGRKPTTGASIQEGAISPPIDMDRMYRMMSPEVRGRVTVVAECREGGLNGQRARRYL